MIDKKHITEMFLAMNPDKKRKQLFWRLDGRLEWHCKHGIGHTVYAPKNSDFIHGCDGCCKGIGKIEGD